MIGVTTRGRRGARSAKLAPPRRRAMEHSQRWRIRWAADAAAIAGAGCGADEKPAQPQACQAVTAHANVTVGSGDDGDPAVPRRASEYVAGKDAVGARTYMVVTAQPL